MTKIIHHRFSWMLFLAIFVLAGTNCNEPSEPGLNEIWMKDFAFIPQQLTVHRGDTVKWINREDPLHHVKSGVYGGAADSLFESGDLGYNDTFAFCFDTLGLFNYYCARHPAMLGSVTVTGGVEPAR